MSVTPAPSTAAPTFEAGASTTTGLASPSRGSTDGAAWRIRFAADEPSPSHFLTREEVFIVLAGALTAHYADRDEIVEAGGALIVPPGEEFTLAARGAPADAVCVMAVGGEAITADGRFTPPWAA